MTNSTIGSAATGNDVSIATGADSAASLTIATAGMDGSDSALTTVATGVSINVS